MNSKQKHTPESWTTNGSSYSYEGSDDKSHYATVRAGDLSITVEGRTAEEAIANAARIVACVNACAGMDDPAEIIHGLHVARETLRTVAEQRDHLLSVLGRIADQEPLDRTVGGKTVLRIVQDMARRAIEDCQQ